MDNYDNVDQHKIANALPEMIEGRLELFTNYINEREKIRKAKESGQPFPWTDDPILRDYRFTNVRRTDDTVSKWYIQNIANNPELTLPQKIYNAILFRAWNKPETSELFQQPILNFTDETLDRLGQDVSDKLDLMPEYKQYGSAYFQSGLKGAWKGQRHSANRMLDMIKQVREDRVVIKICHSTSPSAAFDIINAIKGIGGFLAYQIWVDLTYIPEFDQSEDSFTVAGPGCRLGIDLLVEDRDGMTHEELIFHLRDNQHALDLDIDFQLTVMDIENCFCEFSKYTKRTMGLNNRMRHYQSSK